MEKEEEEEEEEGRRGAYGQLQLFFAEQIEYSLLIGLEGGEAEAGGRRQRGQMRGDSGNERGNGAAGAA